MPIYQVHHPKGILSQEDRQVIADGITDIHLRNTDSAKYFVNVVFFELDAGTVFTAASPSRLSVIVASIRAGRDAKVRQNILRELSELWTSKTGESEKDLMVNIQEAVPADTMEAGLIFPLPGEEMQWFNENKEKLGSLGITLDDLGIVNNSVSDSR